MADRLGLGIIPGTGWPAREIQSVAREAEDAGFDAIFTTEVNNDALGTAQLMGAATRRIQVGTWVANIYLRHPYVCAQGAALISDLTGGRMILGLGVSHQPINRALGIEMPSPAAAHCGATSRTCSSGFGARAPRPTCPSAPPRIPCPSTWLP